MKGRQKREKEEDRIVQREWVRGKKKGRNN